MEELNEPKVALNDMWNASQSYLAMMEIYCVFLHQNPILVHFVIFLQYQSKLWLQFIVKIYQKTVVDAAKIAVEKGLK